MATRRRVDLGFTEECESWKLRSHLFPSKVGSKPSWLGLRNLPSNNDIICPKCNNPTTFLLQVYAPFEEKEEAFHRTIFIFVCKEAGCQKINSNDNFIVFRSQLGRRNEFFRYEPPNENDNSSEYPSADKLNELCDVCGCLGNKRCSKCHISKYCSKEHQTIHWKSGHKKSCCNGGDEDFKVDLLFPEYEILMEEELYNDTKDEENEDVPHTSTEAANSNKFSTKELEKMSLSESDADEAFLKFKKKIERDPDQIIRYERGGVPTWVSNKGIPVNIPDCQCGAKRQFEFQVLPQLLNDLKVDNVTSNMDWGTLAVYTCKESCGNGSQYLKEYLWKQDIS